MRLSLPVVLCLALVALATGRPASAQRADSARAGIRLPADTTPPKRNARRAVQSVRDSLSPPVSPGKAFFLSLAVPGLGQSRLNRPTAGAVYVTTEAIWLAMLVKSANDLHIAKQYQDEVIVKSWTVNSQTGEPTLTTSGAFTVKDSLRSRYAPPLATGTGVGTDAQQRSRVKARRLHLEDWIALLLFNHLFAGADAFVSSQLWDLPAQVEVRSLPAGIGIGAKVPIR